MKIGRLFLLALLVTGVAAADVSNRPSAVEVVAPAPPIPVSANGKQILAYELHITNLGNVPLRLKRIDVNGAEVTKSLRLVGGGKDDDPAGLDIGRRIIAFLWIATDAPPRALKHRLTFDIANATAEPKESVIDGIVVPVSARRPPVLSAPFSEGEWAGAGNSNDAAHRRSVITLEGHPWIAQRFAIDWVRVGSNGNSFHDSREKNENFWAYGTPVRAVADGEVTEVVDAYDDHLPDHPPAITIENIAGNHVILRIAPDTYVLYAHLQHGSAGARLHQRVRRGDVLGRIGNSGSSSGPHLHFQVMDRNSPMAAEGIPFLFDRFTFLGSSAEFEENKHPTLPRRNEMPVDDPVIRFP